MSGKILMAGACGDEAELLRLKLGERGYAAVVATGRSDEPTAEFDAVLVVGDDPLTMCREISPHARERSMVVVDHAPSMPRTVAALRAGVADYLTDPHDIDALDRALRRVLDRRALEERLRRLDTSEEPVGESEAILLGESGTGKEVVARLLHRNGHRRHGPFIAVNCAALPAHLVESEFFGHARGAFTGAAIARRGLLVEASDGTLFLDEVGAMPMPTQAKLLRAIQQRTVRPLGKAAEVEFDARIVAASNVDLELAVANGTFREDLFFRLNVVQIKLPPLRERGLDALLLAQHFILRFAAASHKRVLGMTTGAARALLAYAFPGNVRELQNWIEAAVALTRHDHVTETDLLAHLHVFPPNEARNEDDSLASWDTLEARHIARILEEANGNKAEAARLLGIDRKTLYRKLRRHGSRH